MSSPTFPSPSSPTPRGQPGFIATNSPASRARRWPLQALTSLHPLTVDRADQRSVLQVAQLAEMPRQVHDQKTDMRTSPPLLPTMPQIPTCPYLKNKPAKVQAKHKTRMTMRKDCERNRVWTVACTIEVFHDPSFRASPSQGLALPLAAYKPVAR
jgi:hypothetical protein